MMTKQSTTPWRFSAPGETITCKHLSTTHKCLTTRSPSSTCSHQDHHQSHSCYHPKQCHAQGGQHVTGGQHHSSNQGTPAWSLRGGHRNEEHHQRVQHANAPHMSPRRGRHKPQPHNRSYLRKRSKCGRLQGETRGAATSLSGSLMRRRLWLRWQSCRGKRIKRRGGEGQRALRLPRRRTWRRRSSTPPHCTPTHPHRLGGGAPPHRAHRGDALAGSHFLPCQGHGARPEWGVVCFQLLHY